MDYIPATTGNQADNLFTKKKSVRPLCKLAALNSIEVKVKARKEDVEGCWLKRRRKSALVVMEGYNIHSNSTTSRMKRQLGDNYFIGVPAPTVKTPKIV